MVDKYLLHQSFVGAIKHGVSIYSDI